MSLSFKKGSIESSKHRLFKLFTMFIVLLMFIAGGGLLLLFADSWISSSTRSRTYNNLNEIPHNRVGLLLGTARTLRNGRINLYYKYRIDAAVSLYQAKKIDYLLVSGDNGTKYYDEPTTIKEDLLKHGIPEGKIYLDYAGFRTLDSIVRCREVFGQNSITIISQPFHNERAIFLADHKKINAIGYNARDIKGRYGLKVKIREKFARLKVIFDLLVGVDPKFLGEKVEIP